MNGEILKTPKGSCQFRADQKEQQMRNTGLQPQTGLKGKEKEGHSSFLPASFGESLL